MSKPEECPFCNLDGRVLIENEHANLFPSNPRKVEGHILVTPKRHVEVAWELEAEEQLAIFGLISLAQQRLVEKYGAGCDVRQNYRPFMKQGRIKVDHVHYHVYPRTNEDNLYRQVEQFETPMFTDLDHTEEIAMQRLFK